MTTSSLLQRLPITIVSLLVSYQLGPLRKKASFLWVGNRAEIQDLVPELGFG